MAKFLILARPRKPMPEKANVAGARAQESYVTYKRPHYQSWQHFTSDNQ